METAPALSGAFAKGRRWIVIKEVTTLSTDVFDDGLNLFLSGAYVRILLILSLKSILNLQIFFRQIQKFFFGKTVSNIRKDIEKILYLMKNMNCVLSRYLLSYRIQNLSASIQIKTVFLLFVGSPITYLLPCAYPQMDD